MPVLGKVNRIKYPIPVLHFIEDFVSKIISQYDIRFFPEGYPIHITPLGSPHSFFFSIETIEELKIKNPGHVVYRAHVLTRPYKSDGIQQGKLLRKVDDLANVFADWESQCQEYIRPSILDNDFTAQYEQEYFEAFVIEDEDAENTPFNHQQQHLLQKYLNDIAEDLQAIKSERNQVAIDEILTEVNSLAENLTAETKNSFMRKLTHIWAKAKGVSLKVADYLTTKFIDYVTEEAIEGAIKFAGKKLAEGFFYVEATKLILSHSTP